MKNTLRIEKIANQITVTDFRGNIVIINLNDIDMIRTCHMDCGMIVLKSMIPVYGWAIETNIEYNKLRNKLRKMHFMEYHDRLLGVCLVNSHRKTSKLSIPMGSSNKNAA